MTKKILFDLDDTLTIPRQKITEEMKIELFRLLQLGYEIGIVTGSPKQYLEQQIDGLIDWELTLFPCNGTQMIVPVMVNGKLQWEMTKEVRLATNNTDLNEAKKTLEQVFIDMKVSEDFGEPQGDLIQERQSMLNFCPIGRSSNPERRTKFKTLDEDIGFRTQWLQVLREKLKPLGLQVVLGGVTSFDIFPTGWDKRYSLNHFQNRIYKNSDIVQQDQILFFGNAMFENGNDACMALAEDVMCIHVKDSQDTLEILRKMK